MKIEGNKIYLESGDVFTGCGYTFEVVETTKPTTEDWKVKIYVDNQTGKPIQSTGEIRLYVDNHIGINTYLPGAVPAAGALYTFNVGMNDFSNYDVRCVLNGSTDTLEKYNGKKINEVRFYDSRHWNSNDCGFNVTLEKEGTINKNGATYILKITNK